jgi:arabinoxylan arabinofuranohydrolase
MMKMAFPLFTFVLTMLAARLTFADNPIIQTKYTADPAPLVYDGKVFLYTSHDEDNATGFTMYNWMLYTTTDMANWTDHGIVAGVKAPYNTFPWAAGYNAWAPQTVERNGKFYMYVPLQGSGAMTIAVAVADSPFGPFKDALGKALVSSGTSYDIDPTVFVDDDGQAYLYWGHQPPVFYVKLNQDMISYSGSIVQLTKPQTFEEGPWFYKRSSQYYLAFASTCCPEGIGYAMAAAPTGPWTYKGSIMDGNSQSSGNHPGIIDYKGNSYVFGFNYNVQLQRENQRIGERRSVCVEKMTYNADGTIPKLPFWSTTGPDQIESLDPYVQTEAETIAWAWDVRTETCSEGGMDVTAIENGDYIKVKGVDFGSGAASLDVRVASAGSGGTIEVRLDSQTGKLVGSCAVSGTGGAQTWATKSCPIDGAGGVHDLFFVFTGGSGSLFNFNWWKFHPLPLDGGAGTGGQTGVDASLDAGGAGGAGGGGRGGTQGTGGAGSSGTGGSSGARDASAGAGGAGGTGGQAGSATGGAQAGGGRTGTGGSATSSGVGGREGTGGAGGTTSGSGGTSTAGGAGGATSGSGGAGGTAAGGQGGGGNGAQGGTSSSGAKTNARSGGGCSCTLGAARQGVGWKHREVGFLLALCALALARKQGR